MNKKGFALIFVSMCIFLIAIIFLSNSSYIEKKDSLNYLLIENRVSLANSQKNALDGFTTNNLEVNNCELNASSKLECDKEIKQNNETIFKLNIVTK
ncbi:MAG: hypothetical protein PHQ98_00405 [Candidatus ainarchaeum sp.]|nr:hypothetical protein [Candidatus ainarchaeum sp.]